MVWSQDDPATEAVAQVDDRHAAAEPNHIWKGCSESHNQDLWEGVRGGIDNRAFSLLRYSCGLGLALSLVWVSVAYIVLLEEREVANDSHPHQECGGSQQDATHIV